MAEGTDNSTVKAMLEETIRALLRLEDDVQRNFENVNITRHAINGELQKVMISIGLIHDNLKDMLRKTNDSNLIISSVKDAQVQSKGGMKVLQFLWPLILTLASFALGTYTGMSH